VLAAPALGAEKGKAPAPAATLALMAEKDMAPSSPILIRTFKKESVLEVWKQTREGRFALLKSFPICRWSGQLGPKRRQGDRQSPEGFYAISSRQMNPYSAYHLSFDTGYPNAYDRAKGATGSALMVHGICSSAGCYAMTNRQISEIFALARDALGAGQGAFQMQAYPFRMSAENMAKHRADPNIDFWRQLKEGYDHFEATAQEPQVNVVGARYAFAGRTPALEQLARDHHAQELARIAVLAREGAPAIRTTYSDGGQHAIFMAMSRADPELGEISRPEALAYAGREVVLTPARVVPRPVGAKVVVRDLTTTAPEAPAPALLPLKALSLMSGAAPILDGALARRPWVTLAQFGP
jgi:murein L,D-transpeptidase YafK